MNAGRVWLYTVFELFWVVMKKCSILTAARTFVTICMFSFGDVMNTAKVYILGCDVNKGQISKNTTMFQTWKSSQVWHGRRACFKRRKNALLVNATKHMKKWEHMKLYNILYTSVYAMRCTHNARLFMHWRHKPAAACVPFQPCASINHLQNQSVTEFTLRRVESISPYAY